MRPLRVVFLHPDLGIGGAERLVVDAALALKSRGHLVRFLTSHHDRTHCFPETVDGTLDVSSVGDFLPRRVFGRFNAFFAYFRMIYTALYLLFFSGWRPDLIFVDQISVAVPLLTCFSKARVLFYCHFPDQLLTHRTNWLKKMYRRPLDWLEEWSTGKSHCILVNSRFTAGVFRQTFASLSDIEPKVLYPCVNESSLNQDKEAQQLPADFLPNGRQTYFLSLNRFERKKDISLAIQAMGVLQSKLEENQWIKVHLVVAGGYDVNLPENVDHYIELVRLAENLQIDKNVVFVKSPTAAFKTALLRNCTALLYTPTNEHFGIVPVEAMYCQRPVIATNTGGPLETVVDHSTGLLVPAESDRFAEAMKYFLEHKEKVGELGEAGRKRAEELFSFASFTDKLDETCRSLCATILAE